MTTTTGSFRTAEQLVELGQGVAAGHLVDVGVDLLRSRDVRVAKDDLGIAGRDLEVFEQRRRGEAQPLLDLTDLVENAPVG